VTDEEWEAWKTAHPEWLMLVRANLLCEVMRHADILGSLIQPRPMALACLRDAYHNDRLDFLERVADDFVANLDSLKTSALARLWFAKWCEEEEKRVKAGKPCPCLYCRKGK
jgi:hypothetical protein